MTKILLGLLLLSFGACVQKASEKTVIITLTVPNAKNIKTVGIRGSGHPLSWQKDIPLKEVVKDSVYTLTGKLITGNASAEIKFTVNDTFELIDKPNRILVYDKKSDTTIYNAVFNKN
jgi:hypothetical protein